MEKSIKPLLETATEAMTSEVASLEGRRLKLARATEAADKAAQAARRALAVSRDKRAAPKWPRPLKPRR